MLTLRNVRVEVATYGEVPLREAGERVLGMLETLVGGAGDAVAITETHLAQVAASASSIHERAVLADLRSAGRFEKRRVTLSGDDTPIFVRAKRMNEMIADSLRQKSSETR